jgi:hypothetical protein
MLPTTIGIFGDWGGGKISSMKMLEKFDPENWPEGSTECTQYGSVAWFMQMLGSLKSMMMQKQHFSVQLYLNWLNINISGPEFVMQPFHC